MITVRRISGWDQAEPYRESWNALANVPAGGSLAIPSVFQTYEFNHAWWQSFGAGHELLLLAAFDGEKLAGVAPLMITQRKFPIPSRVVQFIGGSNSAADYCAFLAAPGSPGVYEAFAEWLEANPKLWTELELANVHDSAPELAAFQKVFSGRFFRSNLLYNYDAPTRVFGVAEEDRELVNRSSLKREVNWFSKQGPLKYGHLESVDEILAKLDLFFEQHIGRWEGTSKELSQFNDARQKEFYRTLVRTLAPRGWLRFFEVELNGSPFAFHFGFEFAGKYYWYKPTFDNRYRKRSPGVLLLKTLFDYSIERKLIEFDFTVGNEPYKYRYSNRVRKLFRFRAFRSWPQFAAYEAENRSRALARRLLAPFRRKKAAVSAPVGTLLLIEGALNGSVDQVLVLL